MMAPYHNENYTQALYYWNDLVTHLQNWYDTGTAVKLHAAVEFGTNYLQHLAGTWHQVKMTRPASGLCMESQSAGQLIDWMAMLLSFCHHHANWRAIAI